MRKKRKKGGGFTKKKSIVLTRNKTPPKRNGRQLFRNYFLTRKKTKSPIFLNVVPQIQPTSIPTHISKSRSRSRSRSNSKTINRKTFKIDPTNIKLILDSENNIDNLNDEINRLTILNEKLIHQIYNLTDKIKQIETSNQDVGVCQTISNEGKNERLNYILKDLKDKITYDIKKKLKENPELKSLIIDNLQEVIKSKKLISHSPRITSMLQKKAAEKLPRIVLSFVSSRIAQKVSFACSGVDDYLTTEEIETIANYIIGELKNNN